MNFLKKLIEFITPNGFLIKKCLICERKDNLQCVSDHGIYSEEWVYYHFECIKNVINSPEKYGHKKVDKALWVTELMEIKKRKDKDKRHDLSIAKNRLKDIYDE